MSQRTLTNSQLKSDRFTSRLHPVLQVALGNLDVSLEDELTWYRRQRAGYVSPPPRGLSRVLNHPLLNLSASSAPTAEPLAEAVSSKSPGLNGGSHYSGASSAGLSAGGAAISDRTLPPHVPMPLTTAPPSETPPQDYLESSEELLRSLADEEPAAKPSRSRWLSPLGLGALALFLLSSSALIYLLVKPDSLARLGLPGFKTKVDPEGGRSATATNSNAITDSSTSPRAVPEAPNLAKREFVDLNIDNLSSLKTGRESGTVRPSPSPAPGNAALPIPNNLLMRDLNKSTNPAGGEQNSPGNTLGQRQPSDTGVFDSGAASASNQALAPQPEAQPQRSARQPVPSVPPLPRATSPSPASRPTSKPSPTPRTNSAPQTTNPSPSPSAPASAAQSVPRSYTVSTPYTGDAALDAARQVVPDAYVRNSAEGARIQLGSFNQPEKAQQLVDQLQQQGIQADVNPR